MTGGFRRALIALATALLRGRGAASPPVASKAPRSPINNGLNKGPYPVVFDIGYDIGYMDTPFMLDEATGSNDIMFVGRGSIQTVAVFSPMISGRRWACARTTTAARPGYYATGPQSRASTAPASNSAPLAAPRIRCRRRPIIRFTSAAMSARC
jgi:hypothetical protein